MIGQAGGNYPWRDTKGTGSLSLPFETVLEKAENADIWIGPGQFTTLSEMVESNPHYARFSAFKNSKVYSYSTKKGKTGGIVYFELAPNRPDLVIKDLVKIIHPELLPNYELYFFEKLE
jgi:iron complex transport system substrate-binding protein